eukprot:1968749-Amphidinium_carterae.1
MQGRCACLRQEKVADQLQQQGWTLDDASTRTLIETDGPLVKSRGELKLRHRLQQTLGISVGASLILYSTPDYMVGYCLKHPYHFGQSVTSDKGEQFCTWGPWEVSKAIVRIVRDWTSVGNVVFLPEVLVTVRNKRRSDPPPQRSASVRMKKRKRTKNVSASMTETNNTNKTADVMLYSSWQSCTVIAVGTVALSHPCGLSSGLTRMSVVLAKRSGDFTACENGAQPRLRAMRVDGKMLAVSRCCRGRHSSPHLLLPLRCHVLLLASFRCFAWYSETRERTSALAVHHPCNPVKEKMGGHR